MIYLSHVLKFKAKLETEKRRLCEENHGAQRKLIASSLTSIDASGAVRTDRVAGPLHL
jgi:hypothetical protein